METKTERKLLFYDIDGTLISNDWNHYLPDSTKKALRMARDNGHLVYVNTGRVICNVDPFIQEIGFDGLVCGCGTYVLSEGKVLLHNKLEQKRCREIAYKCREYGMVSIFEQAEQTCFDGSMNNDEAQKILDHFISLGIKIVSDIDDPDFLFDKFATWYGEENPHLDEFVAYVSEDFDCIYREGFFLEVVPKGFSKATGIQVLQEYYDIPLENVYVFGDSNNDLDMMRYAKHSIAMGECSDEVAAVAAYRTDTVENDGIYKAMEHFGVI